MFSDVDFPANNIQSVVRQIFLRTDCRSFNLRIPVQKNNTNPLFNNQFNANCKRENYSSVVNSLCGREKGRFKKTRSLIEFIMLVQSGFVLNRNRIPNVIV